jgi:hypothetical protein
MWIKPCEWILPHGWHHSIWMEMKTLFILIQIKNFTCMTISYGFEFDLDMDENVHMEWYHPND